jgi:hypothetical protein
MGRMVRGCEGRGSGWGGARSQRRRMRRRDGREKAQPTQNIALSLSESAGAQRHKGGFLQSSLTKIMIWITVAHSRGR